MCIDRQQDRVNSLLCVQETLDTVEQLVCCSVDAVNSDSSEMVKKRRIEAIARAVELLIDESVFYDHLASEQHRLKALSGE